MKRAIILVLDSLGLGFSDDAHLYGIKDQIRLDILLKRVIQVKPIIQIEVGLSKFLTY